MRQVGVTAIAVLSVLTPAAASGATLITPENVTVGQNLQTSANIQLSEPAPSGGLQITLTSSDAGKLLLSTDLIFLAFVYSSIKAGSLFYPVWFLVQGGIGCTLLGVGHHKRGSLTH
jgi:hypothetical protein